MWGTGEEVTSKACNREKNTTTKDQGEEENSIKHA